MTTGKELNVRWNVGAKHALYRETGDWYENLGRFPGALFDAYGYIIFHTLKEYEESPYLQIGKQLALPKGISSIPGYIRMEFQIFQRPITEEISDKEQVFEGAKLRVTINAYERSSVARKKCIEHLGTNCSCLFYQI